MGTIGCAETSATNYQYTLRKIPRERRSYIGDCCKICQTIPLVFQNRKRIEEILQKHVGFYVIYGHLREKNKKCGTVREVGEKFNDKNKAFRNMLIQAVENKKVCSRMLTLLKKALFHYFKAAVHKTWPKFRCPVITRISAKYFLLYFTNSNIIPKIRTQLSGMFYVKHRGPG